MSRNKTYISIDNKCPSKKLLTKFEYFFVERWEVSWLQRNSSVTDFHEGIVNSDVTCPQSLRTNIFAIKALVP